MIIGIPIFSVSEDAIVSLYRWSVFRISLRNADWTEWRPSFEGVRR